MAQTTEDALVPSKKRGPGRPRKSSLEPGAKRLKRVSDYAVRQDIGARRQPRGLPTRLSHSLPLPTLSEPQAVDLSDAEYASIAASGVLASSLERSRISWTHAGVFERYWTKPETGKGAAPPPADNPDYKSMKSRGRCRLRVEPHIFEVEVYVVEKPRLPAKQIQQVKQPGTGQQQWYTNQPHSTTSASQPIAKEQAQKAGDQKSSTDPVIGLLAQRAGYDPALKALMHDVAAGRASEQRLQLFQQHIDGLMAEMNTQKAGKAAQHTLPPQQVNAFPQQYAPTTPAAASEVVFAFTTPGACADRFLFPPNSIIELLTPQHMLASFFVTRRGSDAVDPSSFETQKTYFFPVTIMVEVAYGREGILSDIRRWVKPASETREHMQQIMKTCERLPASHLALRLPLKGSADSSSMPNSHAGTPGPEDKEKRKRESKLHMPAAMYKKRGMAVDLEAEKTSIDGQETGPTLASQPAGAASAADTSGGAEATVKTEPSGERRSMRATRKSSRLSEL